MENKKGISKGVLFSSLIIILLVVGIVVGAFYIHNNQPVDVIEENLTGGDISLTYSDEENLFVIENAIPTSDIVGTKYDSAELFFDFTVKTELEDANSISYDVILVRDDISSTSKNENIKIYLEKETNGSYVKVIEPTIFNVNLKDEELGENAMKVYTHSKSKSGSDNYRLRMWISDTAVFNAGEIQNFGVKVAIKGSAK
ncbi:MAG: hypothetical protein J6C28_06665 [Bacilli bacterium]|nr:hypothetical protein [Bacilli bacterium]